MMSPLDAFNLNSVTFFVCQPQSTSFYVLLELPVDLKPIDFSTSRTVGPPVKRPTVLTDVFCPDRKARLLCLCLLSFGGTCLSVRLPVPVRLSLCLYVSVFT